MLKSRKGQEGFTLIELLVVVLIIGILAAIAIPAFLGQKKGAQDANAKSLLRNGAIAMESYFSNTQDFKFSAGGAANDMKAIEPNIVWQNSGDADAKLNQLTVDVNATFDGYALNTISQSKTPFSWVRDSSAKTAKCKGEAQTAPVGGTTPAAAACVGDDATTW